MVARWVVKLVKVPTINDFRGDYFPRQFAYKKDGQALVDEVKRKGGVAVLERYDGRVKSIVE